MAKKSQRVDRAMKRAYKHECKLAVIRAWMRETDEELRQALRGTHANAIVNGDRDLQTDVD